MAVKEMVVCDVCGSPAAAPVTLSVTVNGRRSNFTKDLCKKDLEAYMAKARPARPGRPAGRYSGMKQTSKPTVKTREDNLPELYPEGVLVA